MAKKSTKKKPKQPEHFENIEARHSFTNEEKIEMLSSLARLNNDREALVDQAKASSKSWKARIEEVDLKIRSITNNATSGYELRPCQARVEFNPKKGKKTYYRADTGEEIETRDMTQADYELELFRADDVKKQPAPGDGLVSVSEAVEQAEKAEAAFE